MDKCSSYEYNADKCQNSNIIVGLGGGKLSATCLWHHNHGALWSMDVPGVYRLHIVDVVPLSKSRVQGSVRM